MSLQDIIPDIINKAKDSSTAMKLLGYIESEDNDDVIEFKRIQFKFYVSSLIKDFKEQINTYAKYDTEKNEFEKNTGKIANNLILFIFFPPYLPNEYVKDDNNEKYINAPPDYKIILDLANSIVERRLIKKIPLLFVKLLLTSFVLRSIYSKMEYDTKEFSTYFGILLENGLKNVAVNYIREIITSPSPLILGNLAKLKVEFEKIRNELSVSGKFEHTFTIFIEDKIVSEPQKLPMLTENSAFPCIQHSRINEGKSVYIQNKVINYEDIVFEEDDIEWEQKEEDRSSGLNDAF